MIDPLVVVRAVHFAATVLTAGTLFFWFLVAEPALPAPARLAPAADLLRRGYARLALIGLIVFVLSGAAWLVLLAADLYGAPLIDVCIHGGVWTVLTGTRFGLVWTGRLALVLLLGLLLCWPRARSGPWAWVMILIAAALLGSLAWIGHAGSALGPAAPYHLASDLLHLTAAGVWIGGLPPLAMLLARARQAHDAARWVAAATRRFSRLGMLSVGALLATGIVNTWNLIDGPRDLVATDYGRLILLKIGLFAAMIGIASVNQFRLTPRLADARAMRSLQRNSLAETGLGLCILFFVGALGTIEPTAHAHLPGPAEPGTAFVHIHSEQAVVEVAITRQPTGAARATIVVMTEAIAPLAAKQVTLSLAKAAAGIAPIRRQASLSPEGIWEVDGFTLPQPGRWEVEVELRIGDGDPITVGASILLEP